LQPWQPGHSVIPQADLTASERAKTKHPLMLVNLHTFVSHSTYPFYSVVAVDTFVSPLNMSFLQQLHVPCMLVWLQQRKLLVNQNVCVLTTARVVADRIVGVSIGHAAHMPDTVQMQLRRFSRYTRTRHCAGKAKMPFHATHEPNTVQAMSRCLFTLHKNQTLCRCSCDVVHATHEPDTVQMQL